MGKPRLTFQGQQVRGRGGVQGLWEESRVWPRAGGQKIGRAQGTAISEEA